MGAMYRIICRKLLILIRLAIVLSLAGYSLSTATAAMHGPAAAGASAQISAVMQHGDGAQMSAHDHHQTVSADDDGSNLAKQECCKDFCIGFAIIVSTNTIASPVIASIREFIDDRSSFGELQSLHRPPSL
jgi:hypothetical protein